MIKQSYSLFSRLISWFTRDNLTIVRLADQLTDEVMERDMVRQDEMEWMAE